MAKCVPDEYEMEVQMLIEQSEEETTDWCKGKFLYYNQVVT